MNSASTATSTAPYEYVGPSTTIDKILEQWFAETFFHGLVDIEEIARLTRARESLRARLIAVLMKER
jgi:hypothetical protein